MAVFDRLSAVAIVRYGDATYNNIFYGQVTDEGNPGAQLSGFANVINNQILQVLTQTQVDSVSIDNIVVRRLRPAVTDVYVASVSNTGDLPQAGLSGTCYTLLRYFATPYEKGTAFHWKFTGLPMDANKRGIMTEQAVVRYNATIDAITGGPYVDSTNTYALIRPPKDTDAAGVALPTIYKAQVDNTIRNLRSRQVRL